ncbi:MAG: CRISPR-associated protein (TIGR03986 family) [Psychroserpens sp.]|jgi:CRISPR-associated protein (TIGR03986 family)
MSQVHTPYHFVPLSKWIYMPDWAHLVSHDVPFKDGISGVIDYTLTNATPLCVGGEQKQIDGQPSLVQWAKDPKGNPVIPGSSLKGMIRNVLEIASFGKFNAIDDNHFSFRDISNSNSDYAQFLKRHKVQAGWLKYDNDHETWIFTESDFCKLSHKAIKDGVQISIENKLTAIDKYEKVPLKKEFSANISQPKGVQKNRWADDFNQGSTKGHCVFTNERILGKGNKDDYEFSYFFFNKKSTPHTGIHKKVENLFSNHRSVEAKINGEKVDQVDYLQQNAHPEYGIPVFALKDGAHFHSFGFARMPRVSYEKGAKDLVSNHNANHDSAAYFDMAELMFGTLREEGLSLRSRVSFSDACYMGNVNSLYQSSNVALLSPKSTFLGGYIKQEDSEKYNNYSTKDAIVSGWKRYGIKNDFKENGTDKEGNISSKLELLPEYSHFKGKIVFHNLKKEELSALIWSLNIGGSNFNYHSLGHGKSLGAGAVKFEINQKDLYVQANNGSFEKPLSEITDDFKKHMDNVHYKKDGWSNSTQIKHLLAITDTSISEYNNLDYMDLSQFQGVKTKNLSISLNDINDNEINNNEDTYSRLGTPAFGKGRLSTLVDAVNQWDKDELELQNISEENKEKQLKKSASKELTESIRNSTLSPFEKSKGLLELILANQGSYSKTDKNNKAKELRNIFKELKTVDLSNDEAATLSSIYELINVSAKDTEKALKYLMATN